MCYRMQRKFYGPNTAWRYINGPSIPTFPSITRHEHIFTMGDLADTIITSFSVKFFINILSAYPLHILCGFVVLRLLYNKFLNGITRIPGPAVAAWSGLWRLYDVSKGDAHNTAIKLHRKYGKLVRIGPKHVSVGDPAEIQNIYGLKTGFTKVGITLPMRLDCKLIGRRPPSIPSSVSAGTRPRR
jgi:hypothetical protein